MNNGNVKSGETTRNNLGSGQHNGNAGVMDQAKQAATHLAGEVTEQAKDKVNSTIGAQKDKTAGAIGGVADALRDAGRSLRDHDAPVPVEYVDQAADQIERIGSYIRNRTLGELVDDAEEFARREPAIFFGGAFALGLLTARFLKSSGKTTSTQDDGMSARKMGSPSRSSAPRAMTGAGSATERPLPGSMGSASGSQGGFRPSPSATGGVSNKTPTYGSVAPKTPLNTGSPSSSLGSTSSASTASTNPGSTTKPMHDVFADKDRDKSGEDKGSAGGSSGGL